MTLESKYERRAGMERCIAKVGGCCEPFRPAEHCPMGPSCPCSLRHHALTPPKACGRVESSHAGGALGHGFRTHPEGVPI